MIGELMILPAGILLKALIKICVILIGQRQPVMAVGIVTLDEHFFAQILHLVGCGVLLETGSRSNWKPVFSV